MSQHARTSTPKHAAPKKPARKPAGKQSRTPAAPATSTPLFSSRDLLPLLYLSGAFLFLELLLRIANTSNPFFDPTLLRIIASSLAAGSLLWLVSTIIPHKTVARGIVAAVLLILGVIVIAECCVQKFFGIYYQIAYMLGMGGQVAGDFMDEAVGAILKNLWFFPLALAPGILTVVFRHRVVPDSKSTQTGSHVVLIFISLIVFALAQSANVVACHLGNDNQYYTTEYTANSAIPRFGLVNSLRLEAKYSIFGMPTPSFDAPAASTSGATKQASYKPNALDIDFDALVANDTDDTLRTMDQYFASQVPTQQNQYTGYFKDKNLVFITAEGFSYATIDKERTPALYKLSHNGFVFNNYYQPNWTQSTTGGEFAAMCGIIPTWVNGNTAFAESGDNAMPFGLGWQFQTRGYTTMAYHNNTYTYYGRNITHPNLGYDFIGIGNGLELPTNAWPRSDLKMMQATIDQQIDAYKNNGTPFHTYYMSVSGHCNYGWSVNDMSRKNKDVMNGEKGSETVLAYKASQQELEYALEYLLGQLDEAGIAEDTVIVLTADHYPYAMTENSDVDYYAEMTGINDNESLTTRYKNTLILWCGSMKEPVKIDDPCTAVDIVPTLLNLFGFDYDSRLLSGRDVLAPDADPGNVSTDMHVAIFADYGGGYSWITRAGTYEASLGTFTPAKGVTLDDQDAYIASMNELVRNRYSMAKYIVQTDYYRHVFPNWKGGMTLTEALAGGASS